MHSPYFSPLPTPTEMSLWDQKAQEAGIPGLVLMEHAARAAFSVLTARRNDLAKKTIWLLVGGGNNGGDCLALARFLMDLGASVTCFLAKDSESYKQDAKTELLLAKRFSVPICPLSELPFESSPDILVDGLLGTGFHGPLRKEYIDLITRINDLAIQDVIALDIPSGLDGTTGTPRPVAIKAHLTITFEAAKIGLFSHEAYPYTGTVLPVAIGIPQEILQTYPPQSYLLRNTLNKPLFKQASYKNTYGHILVVGGGSVGICGAAHIAALAALKTGAGLVTVAAPKDVAPSIRQGRAEIMLCPLESSADSLWPKTLDSLESLLARVSSLVIGPGFGLDPSAIPFLEALLTFPNRPPCVLDADALRLLARAPNLLAKLTKEDILTPHPGEAASLLHCSNADIQKDRVQAAQALTTLAPAVFVLKGASTLIAQHACPRILCPFDIPALAIGGSGDALAGILASLLAIRSLMEPCTLPQGISQTTYLASQGVLLHAKAGLLLAQTYPDRGGLVTELCNFLPKAWSA